MKKYQSVNYRNICINGGFWKNRQDINAKTTAQAVYNRFSDSHRFEALDCKWKEGMNYTPHIFWDSDVAKWLEGAAYIIAKTGEAHLEKLCDNAIDMIVANQDKDGYFNSHFLVMEQERRFKDRNCHELYCAGHLIEAACAYYEATGKDKFLNAMCKFADYIYDVFYEYQTASFTTCGHPEIELALVKLYDTTGNEKYLKLSKFFLDQHGNNEKDKTIVSGFTNEYYSQDQLPLILQRTAEGHSVRAMYLYSAMADIAKHYDNKEYMEACEAIFENVVTKKMYITGGIGSTNIGEAFTTDYFLPNSGSYTETCAAIALALFGKRMQLVSNDSKYADIVERVIFNGFLSGVSLDGKSFFYENPLEIDPYFANVNTATKQKRHVPIMQRVELFDCSCCPPNVLRFIASIAELLYTYDETTLYVHQFMESDAAIAGTTVTQTTAYPADGTVKITVSGDSFAKIAVRIPGWCSSFTASAAYTLKNGYAFFAATDEITISFQMDVVLYEANSHVQNNAGRVAVARGPVIYCLEEVDNGKHLRSLLLNSKAQFTVEDNAEYHVPVLLTQGMRKKETNNLYQVLSSQYETVSLRFIPYFAFANRGVSEMLVWIPVTIAE